MTVTIEFTEQELAQLKAALNSASVRYGQRHKRALRTSNKTMAQVWSSFERETDALWLRAYRAGKAAGVDAV